MRDGASEMEGGLAVVNRSTAGWYVQSRSVSERIRFGADQTEKKEIRSHEREREMGGTGLLLPRWPSSEARCGVFIRQS